MSLGVSCTITRRAFVVLAVEVGAVEAVEAVGAGGGVGAVTAVEAMEAMEALEVDSLRSTILYSSMRKEGVDALAVVETCKAGVGVPGAIEVK
jgi:hypothetical protein